MQRDAVRHQLGFPDYVFSILRFVVSQGIDDINANSSKSVFCFFALNQSFGVCFGQTLLHRLIQLYSMGYVTGKRLCAAHTYHGAQTELRLSAR